MPITLQDLEAARDYAFKCLIHATYLYNLAKRNLAKPSPFARQDWERALQEVEGLLLEPSPSHETRELLRREAIFTSAGISQPSAHEWCFEWSARARRVASWSIADHRHVLFEAGPRFAELTAQVNNPLASGPEHLAAAAELRSWSYAELMRQHVAPLLSADQEPEEVAQLILVLEREFSDRTAPDGQQVASTVELEHTLAKRRLEMMPLPAVVPWDELALEDEPKQTRRMIRFLLSKNLRASEAEFTAHVWEGDEPNRPAFREALSRCREFLNKYQHIIHLSGDDVVIEPL